MCSIVGYMCSIVGYNRRAQRSTKGICNSGSDGCAQGCGDVLK
jgi:hypothetical protein